MKRMPAIISLLSYVGYLIIVTIVDGNLECVFSLILGISKTKRFLLKALQYGFRRTRALCERLELGCSKIQRYVLDCYVFKIFKFFNYSFW